MIRLLLILAALLGLSSCHSFVKFFLPDSFDSVTAERCQKLDMKALGFENGKLGQRKGDRFEFWVKDCEARGIALDRALYDQGYDEGNLVYCSCENGYVSGARGEFEELKGQFGACTKARYEAFKAGRALGDKKYGHLKFPQRDNELKLVGEDGLMTEGKAACASSVTGGESSSSPAPAPPAPVKTN